MVTQWERKVVAPVALSWQEAHFGVPRAGGWLLSSPRAQSTGP